MSLKGCEQPPLYLVGLRGTQGNEGHLVWCAADIVSYGGWNVLKSEASKVHRVVQPDVHIPTGTI